VAATAGYQGVFGIDFYHHATAWLAAAIRPGDFRIALGPTYGFLYQDGEGVAPWLTYEDGTAVEEEYLRLEGYSGNAWGGGAQLSVGYGVVDWERLQGVVELGAQWMGGPRDYFGIGIRVGIVPKVPRFEG
jgi:hypothetical protein